MSAVVFHRRARVVAAIAAVLLSLAGGAVSTAISSVLMCTSNIYADGFIYRNTSSDGSSSTSLEGLAPNVTFPLYLAITSHDNAPLDPIQPARKTAMHAYTALDALLYINASTDASEPVGFAAGAGNTSLGTGETTWGFYAPGGILLWYAVIVDGPVHAMGFQWLAVAGFDGLTQLHWNQTFYDLAAAAIPGTSAAAAIAAAAQTFGNCAGDPAAVVTAA